MRGPDSRQAAMFSYLLGRKSPNRFRQLPEADEGVRPALPGSGWQPSLLLLGLTICVIYMANGREIGTGDTFPTTLLTVAILRGDGLTLDRFSEIFPELKDPDTYYITVKRGHILSRYPVAPALLAAPFAAPQLLVLDRLRPGWERDPRTALSDLSRMGKNCSAMIAALVAVALFQLLRALGLGGMALWATSIASLGSNLWTVASQSLWQHGPAALALTLSLTLLVSCGVSRPRIFLAGLASAAMVAFRAVDLVLAVAIFGWVVLRHRRDAVWFVLSAVAVAAVLLGYNHWYFGALWGGLGELEALSAPSHAVEGTWSGNLLDGAAGTLLSPSRGLLIFTPWIAVALATLPAVAYRVRAWSLVSTALWMLVPYLLLLSKYSVWWAGHSYGPRYWTDVIPLFAILLGFGLDWSWRRSRLAFLAFVLASAIGVGVQVVGAFCYTGSWNLHPADADLHHGRLWDWRDNEIFRSATECFQRR